jgi:hypothetical protein
LKQIALAFFALKTDDFADLLVAQVVFSAKLERVSPVEITVHLSVTVAKIDLVWFGNVDRIAAKMTGAGFYLLFR